MNRFSFKNLYLYGICAITLIMAIIGVLQLGNHIVNLLIPYHYSATPSSPPDATFGVEDQRGIVYSLIQIAVAVPIYMYHWKLARRTEH